MTIRELINKKDPKNVEFLEMTNKFLNNFNTTVNNTAISINTCIEMYRKELSDLHKAYFDTFTQKVFVQQIKRQNVINNVMHRFQNRISINEALFNECALFEISILIAKYPGNVSEAQVKLGLFKMVFDNCILYMYDPFEKTSVRDEFLLKLKDYIEAVLDMDINKLTPINKEGIVEQMRVKTEESDIRPMNRPYKPQHLTSLWQDGMTRAERVKAVVNYYGCGDKTARRWMEAYGVYESPNFVDYETLYHNALKEIDSLKNTLEQITDELRRKNDFINKHLF